MIEHDRGPAKSFLSLLMKKLSDMKRIEQKTGISTESLQAEVNRQITQALRGDLIEGHGVTKSGGDD